MFYRKHVNVINSYIYSKLIPFLGNADGVNGMISLVTTLISFHSSMEKEKYNGNPIVMNAEIRLQLC